MDFIDRLQNLSKKIELVGASLKTEEATKNALIMPFLQSVLGYDVFNPNEVHPEFTADVGSKKGEKVDYAILQNDQPQILIECKKYGDNLSIAHAAQLFRYFSATTARIGVLTNGDIYEFYTDLDSPNKMDEKPFLVLKLSELDEHIIPEVKKLTKSKFDVDAIVNVAGELKYLNQIKKILEEQFRNPEEDFIKFFISKIYDGVQTSKVKAQFAPIMIKALKQFLNDSINERLKNAITPNLLIDETKKTEELAADTVDDNRTKAPITQDEIDGLNIVKAILRVKFDVSRIVGRETQGYFGILLDDNNRKPLCRLHFLTKNKYIGIIGANKKETRYLIESLDQIYALSDLLLESVVKYESELTTDAY